MEEVWNFTCKLLPYYFTGWSLETELINTLLWQTQSQPAGLIFVTFTAWYGSQGGAEFRCDASEIRNEDAGSAGKQYTILAIFKFLLFVIPSNYFQTNFRYSTFKIMISSLSTNNTLLGLLLVEFSFNLALKYICTVRYMASRGRFCRTKEKHDNLQND